MAKISPTSIKYIIRAKFKAEGTIEKPDVIGAVFGQTEGLLGNELELRELQKEGKIGRIEVTLDTNKEGTQGIIEIPTSMDKAETALIAAALETIERVGPSEASIKVESIEDVRTTKREYVMERAKHLLSQFQAADSNELAESITENARMMNILEFGKDKLPAGAGIIENAEIIIVEGRADVINLLRHGINNAIALNGTSVPETIIELCSNKIATVFVDGDRGGELILKDLTKNAEINYIAKAPDGKEVEELAKKEILKALRDRIKINDFSEKNSATRIKDDHSRENREEIREGREGNRQFERSGSERIGGRRYSRSNRDSRDPRSREDNRQDRGGDRQDTYRERGMRDRDHDETKIEITRVEKEKFSELLDELTGTRGAYVLDKQFNILGKVPANELYTILRSVQAHVIIADTSISPQLMKSAETAGVKIIVAKEFFGRPFGSVKILTQKDLV